MNEEKFYTLDQLDQMADLIINLMDRCKVFTFTGSLGAGKTTLIKRVLARCGVSDVVTSPTFTYVALYSNDQDETFYHFDLYRLHTLNDFVHAGFEEYLYAPDSWSFIEWPSIVMPLLTHNVCHVSIEYHSESDRLLKLTVHE